MNVRNGSIALLTVLCFNCLLFAQPNWQAPSSSAAFCGVRIGDQLCGHSEPPVPPENTCAGSGRCRLQALPNDPDIFEYKCLKLDPSLYAHETVHNPSYTVREDVYSRATGILSIATQEIYKICSRTHQCLPRCEADSQSVRICVIDTQTLVGSISGFVYHAPAMGPHQDPSLYNCANGGNSGGGGGSNGGGGSGGGSGSGGNGSSSGGNYP